jgi:hypothetical protein
LTVVLAVVALLAEGALDDAIAAERVRSAHPAVGGTSPPSQNLARWRAPVLPTVRAVVALFAGLDDAVAADGGGSKDAGLTRVRTGVVGLEATETVAAVTGFRVAVVALLTALENAVAAYGTDIARRRRVGIARVGAISRIGRMQEPRIILARVRYRRAAVANPPVMLAER